ncbi:hypothetical protein BDZ89DRAFT_1114201 [Hymenopellis radicata]|nr:hypothetical protein BDZ89DRAFT_1114201 [Hymenopellis radicata]
MTKGPRRIAVDDADVSRIHYSGNWTTENGAHDDISKVYGPTYEHTQHGTIADGASISFLFNGSSIQVFGSWDQDHNETLPSWECFVDSVKIEKREPVPPSTNQNELCWDDNIDGTQEHALTVNITTPSNVNTLFWFDYIVYTPYDDDLYNHTTMWLGKDDNAITYGGGWEDSGDARMVAAKGASLSAKFNGSSIRMVGPIKNATYASVAEYSIDGGTASTFSISKNDGTYDMLWSQTIFESGQLSTDKEHTLTVQWDGEASYAQQFGIENFYIDTPTYAATSDDSDDSSTPIAAIVGGVVGGIVLLAAIAGFLWFWRRRHSYSSVSETDFDLSGPQNDPFSARHSFFASSDRLNATVISYDPYTESPAGTMTMTASSKRASVRTSYSGAPSVSGSMSASPTSAGFTPTSGYFMPAGAQSRKSTTLSPPPTDESVLVAMKNEQSYAVRRASSMSSASASASASSSGSSPTQFRKHQDSGLRVTNNGEVVDLPPDYQPS